MHPGVRDACVTAEPTAAGGRELVAWLLVEESCAPSIHQLQEFSRQHLPNYMAPTRMVVLSELPLNANGKVDRTELTKHYLPAATAAANMTGPMDSVQGALVGIWKKVLGVENVSLDAGFFELGGHSLLGTQLLVEIEKRFGVHLPLAVLFKTSTVRGLAEVVRRGGWSTEWNSMVAIQPQGDRPPFFSIHGDPSRLAPYLDPQQPYFWLHRGQDGSLLNHASVEEVAMDHLKEILAVQPEGPYYLGGYSFGGLLALEVAKRLRARGEEIAMLALFDPPAPRLAATDLPAPSLAKRLGALPATLLWSLQWTRRLVRRAGLRILEQVHLAAGKPLPNRLRYARHGRLYSRASRNYHYGTYEGHTLLFSPNLEPHELEILTTRWRSVVPDHLEVHMVPDAPCHGDLFEEPGLQYLAHHLAQNLGAGSSEELVTIVNLNPTPTGGSEHNPRSGRFPMRLSETG
jgi:thioesterase domain-containing protein/acyl carrier protein